MTRQYNFTNKERRSAATAKRFCFWPKPFFNLERRFQQTEILNVRVSIIFVFKLGFNVLMVLEVFICSLRFDFYCGTLNNPHCQADRVVLSNVMAVFERSCLLDDFEASTIENAAAVSNLDNIAMCFCCGCLRERETTFVSTRAMKGISGNT